MSENTNPETLPDHRCFHCGGEIEESGEESTGLLFICDRCGKELRPGNMFVLVMTEEEKAHYNIPDRDDVVLMERLSGG